jgi:AsmA protein
MKETANGAALAARRVKMLRISWLVGALAAIAILAALTANMLLTGAVLNSRLTAQIRHTTGFLTAIHGTVRFALFPQPHIDIERISFSNPQAALHVDAARFVGYLRILPLLAGRIEVGHAVLYQPKMVIDLDDRPITPDSAIGRAAAAKSASAEAATIDRAKLGIVDLVDGSARLHHNGGKQDIFIDKINVTADWRSLDASATLTGQFDIRNVPMQLKAWVAQPVEILRGGDSAMTVQLESDALGVQASGRVALVHLHYTGGLYITAPSLRRALELAGFSLAKHGRFDAFDLRCDADINTTTTSLTNLRLDLDNNEYEGTLAVQPDGETPRLSGTLATNLLDVTPFLEGMPQPLGPKGGWSQAPLELADLGFTNLDLRLSASRLRLHDIELKDAALSMLTRPGFIDFTLAEATANGGAVRGRLSLLSKGKALDLRLSGSATDVNLKPMLRGAPVKHPLSGALSGSLTLESTGAGFDQLMHGLSGHAQVNITNGRFTGVDLLSALQKAKPVNPIAPENSTQNITDFDKAAFGLKIAHGVANIVDGHVDGPAAASGFAGHFGGSADLGGRSLNLWALAVPVAAPGTGDVQVSPLRVRLTGPWEHLNLAVDRPPSPSSVPPP